MKKRINLKRTHKLAVTSQASQPLHHHHGWLPCQLWISQAAVICVTTRKKEKVFLWDFTILAWPARGRLRIHETIIHIGNRSQDGFGRLSRKFSPSSSSPSFVSHENFLLEMPQMQPPKPFFKSFESSFTFASPQYVVIASGGSNSCGLDVIDVMLKLIGATHYSIA